ncbi:MAG: SbcC/MukB-like Walker B domain-containing protein [Oribacterium sp.]|nr:SbcC/MukB-like Walker B domain-containing protein [Oribacterium sp.]MDY6317422.1 SbcC/MukB-like Walker B domain-containing protein [Oribacterium sp.]
MKLLRKIRLINWHRFENETIDFGRSTLLSGENGAGKSTILDAIQFVVTCSKSNFNTAAQEKGKRNLNSYIRCKTGQEKHPFDRVGALSADIALEFYDEKSKKPFIIGVVMDTASEEKEPDCAWYLIENRELNDEFFFIGDRVKSISVFRSTNKCVKTFCKTQREAKDMIKNRFGRIDDKFFSLIPKALAFKPIADIKDFVYSYVLDEKAVNIDALRENVRSFQNLEHILQDVKTRIAELEAITAREQEVERFLRLDRTNEYYIARAELGLVEETLSKLSEDLSKQEIERKRLMKLSEDNASAREEKETLIRNLSVELESDETNRAYMEAKKKEAALISLLDDDAVKVKRLYQQAKRASESVRAVLELEEKKGNESSDLLKNYMSMLSDLRKLPELSEVRISIPKVITYKQRRFKEIQTELADRRVQLRQKETELSEINERVKKLEDKQLVYRPEVLLLKEQIEEALREAGREPDVRIICELLEVADPKWQNAIEGYLNTQRFYLLVEPAQFDLALSVYDKLRARKKVYGVGLINTGKLEDYDDAPVGSLAEMVTSKNMYARRYINMVLGKVQRASSYQELKKYPVSITMECMRYQNHVVSAISPSVYRTPYIGAGAYKIQLEQAKEEQTALNADVVRLRDEIKTLEQFEGPLDSAVETELKFGLDNLDTERSHRAALDACRSALKELKADQTLIEKRLRLEEMQDAARKLSQDGQDLLRALGRCDDRIEQDEAKIEEQKKEADAKHQAMDALRERTGEDSTRLDQEYEKLTKGRVLSAFRDARASARKGYQTQKDNALEAMRTLMREYRVKHDFGAADSMEGYPEYKAEYDKLKNSQLLEYEDKVFRARQAAEEEFREQFLSKLQENIRNARDELDNLNDALRDIHFSHESYRFDYQPSHKHLKYYDMIMDDFNVMAGNSIFSGTFNAQHKEVIEELFSKLALDDENANEALEIYTDYRTYMDYDIKITNDDGTYMLYSKVSREKSGGETQTPFYITVAASFMQLYHNSIGGMDNAIGLIMMDEAFNNMDDARIAGVLSFMTHSNLQTIIAAPPDKIQYIGPQMEKVLLVLTDDKLSYVEDFTHEAAEENIEKSS